jgi:hypothetical protein
MGLVNIVFKTESQTVSLCDAKMEVPDLEKTANTFLDDVLYILRKEYVLPEEIYPEPPAGTRKFHFLYNERPKAIELCVLGPKMKEYGFMACSEADILLANPNTSVSEWYEVRLHFKNIPAKFVGIDMHKSKDFSAEEIFTLQTKELLEKVKMYFKQSDLKEKNSLKITYSETELPFWNIPEPFYNSKDDEPLKVRPVLKSSSEKKRYIRRAYDNICKFLTQ